MKCVHLGIIVTALTVVSCVSDSMTASKVGPMCAKGACSADEVCEDGECRKGGDACEGATTHHNGFGYCEPGFVCADGDCHARCGDGHCKTDELCCDAGNGPVCMGGSDSGMATCTTCESGFANCDGDWSNGCESLAGVENCGSCGNTCDAGEVCTNGECGVACDDKALKCRNGDKSYCLDASAHMKSCSACEDSYANCDEKFENGCETDLSADAANCGECGSLCDGECISGQCRENCSNGSAPCETDGVFYCADDARNMTGCTICATGFGNCNDDWADGCETNTLGSDDNCGACGEKCLGKTCVDGKCVEPCKDAEIRCNSGESTYCVNMAAGFMTDCGVCAADHDNCNGDWSDGCETTLGTREQCGKCGEKCPDSQVCSEGKCSDDCAGTEIKCVEDGLAFCVKAKDRHLESCDKCETGYANCNDSYTDGCEIKLEALHLDDCEKCSEGYANCDGDWTNGCEVNLTASHRASCESCDENYCLVGGACVSNDSINACGASCSSCADMPNAKESSCFEGACVAEKCETGYELCNGLCIDTQTSVNNCGACGVKCNGSCVNGVCSGDVVKTCGAVGGDVCDLPEMCCANLTTGEYSCRAEGPGYQCFPISPTSCGSSRRNCKYEPDTVKTTCVGGGVCHVLECKPAFHLSSLDPGNECVGNADDACGPVDNIAVSCKSFRGAISGTCTKGYCISSACGTGTTLCNSICADLQTDKYNCGACGRVCTSSDCVGGSCQDGRYHDGCGATGGDGCSSDCCTNLATGEISCVSNSLAYTYYTCSQMKDYFCGPAHVNCTLLENAKTTQCRGGGTCLITECKSGYHVNHNNPGNACVRD